MKAGLHPGQVNSSSQGHIEELKTIHTRLVPVANLNFPIRHTCVFWTARESRAKEPTQTPKNITTELKEPRPADRTRLENISDYCHRK